MIDTKDPEQLALFWCALLGVEVQSRFAGGEYVTLGPTSEGLTVTFQRVPEPKAGKNRLHLDLMVDNLDAATTEVGALGGHWLEPGITREVDGFRWRCMADPEGNEFDIVPRRLKDPPWPVPGRCRRVGESSRDGDAGRRSLPRSRGP